MNTLTGTSINPPDRDEGFLPRWVFIAWFPQSRRSEMFSRTLGGNLHCIYYLGRSRTWIVPIKYFLQALRTLQILLDERPAVVHVQNPPFVASLIVYLYSKAFHSKYVIDHHSAAFSNVWDWALAIQKKLARTAKVKIVTNQYWADIIQGWEAQTLIMGDAFLDLPPGSDYQVSNEFNIVFICTFSEDEPLKEAIDAVSEMDNVHLYITGDATNVAPEWKNNIPRNITLTGFLPDEEYIGLLRSVDSVMVLTTRDHTLQMGGCEAVAVNQPLITSNWPYLQKYFNRGTIYVDNTPAGIREGIKLMIKDRPKLREGIYQLKIEGREEWDIQLNMLRNIAETSE
jgi:glycosyltransferase involved in cell wall biosynthesis